MLEKAQLRSDEYLLSLEKDAPKIITDMVKNNTEAIKLYWRQGDGNGGQLLNLIAYALGHYDENPCSLTQHRLQQLKMQESGPKRSRYMSKTTRTKVMKRDKYTCVYCGSREDLCLDHIYPVSLGGSSTPGNLQILCRSCNSRKGAKITEEDEQ